MIRLSGFPGAYGLPGRILMPGKMNCTVNMQDRERKSDEVINQKAVGDRIRAARLAAGMTQEELGEKLDVSFQAVSTWEQGKCLPDTDRLPELTKVLGCSMDSLFAEGEKNWKLKPVNYDVSHMYTFVKGRAQMLGLSQTLRVMELLRPAHGAQQRKSRYGFDCSYMAHPLTMACHALAMGLQDDDVIAAVLAHDMVEDADMKPSDLPAGERVQEAVRLVSKNMYDRKSPDWEERYFACIRENPLACMVKCLDRTNNLAGMADGFRRDQMIRYTEETDRYYPALLEVLKKVPEWNNAWWLIRYQMMSMTEAFKRLL